MEDFASSAPDILRADHICKAFADKQVLRDVNVRLAPGELVCILGVSGVGKTTLFKSSPASCLRTAAIFCWLTRTAV